MTVLPGAFVQGTSVIQQTLRVGARVVREGLCDDIIMLRALAAREQSYQEKDLAPSNQSPMLDRAAASMARRRNGSADPAIPGVSMFPKRSESTPLRAMAMRHESHEGGF